MRGCERILFFYQMQKINLCVANSIFYVADVQSEDAADESKVKYQETYCCCLFSNCCLYFLYFFIAAYSQTVEVYCVMLHQKKYIVKYIFWNIFFKNILKNTFWKRDIAQYC